MGYSKNYIMYWGVFTGIIIPSLDTKVSTKLHLFFTFFCAYSLIFHSFYISQKTTVFFRIFFCDFLQFIKSINLKPKNSFKIQTQRIYIL